MVYQNMVTWCSETAEILMNEVIAPTEEVHFFKEKQFASWQRKLNNSKLPEELASNTELILKLKRDIENLSVTDYQASASLTERLTKLAEETSEINVQFESRRPHDTRSVVNLCG